MAWYYLDCSSESADSEYGPFKFPALHFPRENLIFPAGGLGPDARASHGAIYIILVRYSVRRRACAAIVGVMLQH